MSKIFQPPYHLRTNKAIDRFYLIELLQFLSNKHYPMNYSYHSLGGPYLADLKLLHRFFPHIKLNCIESNSEVFKRQKFHSFASPSILRLNNGSISDYLTEFIPNERDIFWLDYTNFEKSIFDEFSFLIAKLSSGSIVRITCKIEQKNISTDAGALNNDWFGFKSMFGRYIPSSKSAKDIARQNSRQLLVLSMFENAASIALPSEKENCFQILQAATYSDGTKMLTVTGMVIERSKLAKLYKALKSLSRTTFNYTEIVHIDIPELSIKERLHLEEILPSKDCKELCERVGYLIADSPQNNERFFEQYRAYYKYYPYFSALNL